MGKVLSFTSSQLSDCLSVRHFIHLAVLVRCHDDIKISAAFSLNWYFSSED